MRVAVMQPYVFPYLGYFQLINACEVFVFYDDVNFIKRGWINRNQLLVNNEAKLFSIPLIKASQNKLINSIELGYDQKWLGQFYQTLEQNYKKAPHFETVFELVTGVFNQQSNNIGDLAISSITAIANHLELPTVFQKSSEKYPETKGLDKADRLIAICNDLDASDYVNPSGGKELYNKAYFNERGISLSFIENNLNPYNQFKGDFVPGLSMIDVLMFNDKESIHKMLDEFELV